MRDTKVQSRGAQPTRSSHKRLVYKDSEWLRTKKDIHLLSISSVTESVENTFRTTFPGIDIKSVSELHGQRSCTVGNVLSLHGRNFRKSNKLGTICIAQ
jgi:hypothetical protein